jgi:hypothetical protein
VVHFRYHKCVLLRLYCLFDWCWDSSTVFQPVRKVPRPEASCFDVWIHVLLRCSCWEGPVYLQDQGIAQEVQYAYLIVFPKDGYLRSRSKLDSPIIRISPHELHVIDPDFYDALFAGAHTRRDKPPTWSHAFTNIDSVFSTISHDTHRIRRAALNPLFSASSLRKLEPLVQSNISRLISVFRKYQSTGEVLPLRPAFAALTSDIIAEYCFGGSENYIEAEGFNVMVLDTTDVLTENMHVTVQLQWLPKLMDALPDWLVEGMLGPGMAKFNELKRVSFSPFREFQLQPLRLSPISIASKRSKKR